MYQFQIIADMTMAHVDSGLQMKVLICVLKEKGWSSNVVLQADDPHIRAHPVYQHNTCWLLTIVANHHSNSPWPLWKTYLTISQVSIFFITGHSLSNAEKIPLTHCPPLEGCHLSKYTSTCS